MPPHSSQQLHSYTTAAASSRSRVNTRSSSPRPSSSTSSSSSTRSSRSRLGLVTMPVSLNKNTLIHTARCRFLIMDAPTDRNLAQYIEQMKKHRVTALVRACEPSYNKAPVEKEGIRVEDMFFADGSGPSEDVLSRWLDLADEVFADAEGGGGSGGKKRSSKDMKAVVHGEVLDEKATLVTPSAERRADDEPRPACVAVHCVAGLGRAPVLVALALIELERLDAFSAIEAIRGQRRGAFNSTQLDFLEHYKRRRRRRRGGKMAPQCVIQ